MPVYINAHPTILEKGANTQNEKLATEYFLEKNKNVYRFVLAPPERQAEGDLAIESFEDYLNERWGGECYYYSTAGLMGLENDAQLVRGAFTTRKFDSAGWYEHGWDVFDFEKNKYAFDYLYDGVINIDEYYDYHKPQIQFSTSKKKLLDKYLSRKYCIKAGNIRQTTKFDNTDVYCNQIALFPGSQFVMSGRKLKECILDLDNLHKDLFNKRQKSNIG